MKNFSTERPAVTLLLPNGATRFTFNVTETEEGFNYNYIDVVGEFTRPNIVIAFLMEEYTQEELTEIENVLSKSKEAMAKLKTNVWKAQKALIEAYIDDRLGSDFE